MKKACVFISCGQIDHRESLFGKYLEKYFKGKRFETYLAVEIHNSKPLLLSILSALRESEYMVCFNPYRSPSDIGSLFVQQEIAVSAASDIPVLAFHEHGVDKTKGMLGNLHVNSLEVKVPTDMKKTLDKEVVRWDPISKNQLFLSMGNPSINIPNQNGMLTNWWHITCLNGSSYKHAKNCMAYMEEIVDLNRKQVVNVPYRCEIVWAGVGMHNITILKKFERDFDAIFTFNGSGVWQPQILQTSTIYTYPPLSDGRYRITYLVVSDNFPDARVLLDLELKQNFVKIIAQKQQ